MGAPILLYVSVWTVRTTESTLSITKKPVQERTSPYYQIHSRQAYIPGMLPPCPVSAYKYKNGIARTSTPTSPLSPPCHIFLPFRVLIAQLDNEITKVLGVA